MKNSKENLSCVLCCVVCRVSSMSLVWCVVCLQGWLPASFSPTVRHLLLLSIMVGHHLLPSHTRLATHTLHTKVCHLPSFSVTVGYQSLFFTAGHHHPLHSTVCNLPPLQHDVPPSHRSLGRGWCQPCWGRGGGVVHHDLASSISTNVSHYKYECERERARHRECESKGGTKLPKYDMILCVNRRTYIFLFKTNWN